MSDKEKEYVTIYGDVITGEISSVFENTVIVRTAKGGQHMVRKKSLADNAKDKKRPNRLGCRSEEIGRSEVK